MSDTHTENAPGDGKHTSLAQQLAALPLGAVPPPEPQDQPTLDRWGRALDPEHFQHLCSCQDPDCEAHHVWPPGAPCLCGITVPDDDD